MSLFTNVKSYRIYLPIEEAAKEWERYTAIYRKLLPDKMIQLVDITNTTNYTEFKYKIVEFINRDITKDLVETLRFYANEENYEGYGIGDSDPEIIRDKGKKATYILAKLEKKI